MILRLLCPSGHVLDVDAQLAGRKIRCGACGAIMIVPAAVKAAVQKPAAKPPARPVPKPQTAAPAKPSLAKTVVKPPAVKNPTAELPAATAPSLPREPGMVAVPMPPVAEPQRIAEPPDEAAAGGRSRGLAVFTWFRNFWPAAEIHLPADVTVPGKVERRTALQLAVVLGVIAVVSLLPVFGKGHADLRSAPPWALAAVLLAVLQLVFAIWMINAPDWASARVQMAVSAVVTTIYGMLMTLTIVAKEGHPLILRLEEVRRQAPAWCGLMFVLMGAVTWFCGWSSVRWRRRLYELVEENS